MTDARRSWEGRRSFRSVKLYREELEQILALYGDAGMTCAIIADEVTYTHFDELERDRRGQEIHEITIASVSAARAVTIDVTTTSAKVEWSNASGLGRVRCSGRRL